MIGIAAVATYSPATGIDNVARADAAQKTPAFISDKIGFRRLARKGASETTISMCVSAYEDLQRSHPHDKSTIDCIILCTQNPDNYGLPHNSAILQAKLQMPNTLAAFDVSLGCSGYVYCLSIARSFMEANGLRHGLLFTADPYSKIIEDGDWDTDLLFGDGSSVTLLQDDPLFSIRPGIFSTDGSMGHSIARTGPDGYLRMHGANVFKFCMNEVPRQIEKYLEREGVHKDDVDLFLFHQGSRFIIENLARKLCLDETKAPFGAAEQGNLVSSSIPFLLKDHASSQKPPERILLGGFGVGLSWGSIMIEKNALDRQGRS